MPTQVLADALRDIERRANMNSETGLLEGRQSEFTSVLEMKLAGMAMNARARARFEERLDEYWDTARRDAAREGLPRVVNEVVIGAGLHAAVYCAARVLAGKPGPLVLERSNRPGGVFAMSRRPSFFLNSTNRPGDPGLPGEVGALNYLPGAPLQPSMLTTAQYSDNTDIALVVRIALAEYATVAPGAEVAEIGTGGGVSIRTTGGQLLNAQRVIDARGLGVPRDTGNGSTLLTFPQFMASLDDPFPFRGVGDVAVIGDGDSARCAVEALLGIGPARHMSVAGLDYIPNIDWFTSRLPRNCQDWRQRERGRYQSIGSFLPRQGTSGADLLARSRARLNIIPQRGRWLPTLDGVLAGNRTYSRVILCTGWTLRPLTNDQTPVTLGGAEPLAVARADSRTCPYYAVGPAAQLPFTEAELLSGVGQVPANKTAVFRLAPRTAALAMNLP